MQRGPVPEPNGTLFAFAPKASGCSKPVEGVIKNALTVLAALVGVRFGPKLATYTNLFV